MRRCSFICARLCAMSIRKKTGSDLTYQDYFELPMREVEFPKVSRHETIDWRKYYPDGLKDEVFFDEWGVARLHAEFGDRLSGS